MNLLCKSGDNDYESWRSYCVLSANFHIAYGTFNKVTVHKGPFILLVRDKKTSLEFTRQQQQEVRGENGQIRGHHMCIAVYCRYIKKGITSQIKDILFTEPQEIMCHRFYLTVLSIPWTSGDHPPG